MKRLDAPACLVSNLFVIVSLLSCLPSSQATLITRSENFDEDPGWVSSGSGVNGNNFGYQESSSFAGGSEGEVGGRFTRSGFDIFYGDVFPKTFDLSEEFAASGLFDTTGRNHPDFGLSMMIGFFNTDENINNRIGINFTDVGTPDLHWNGRIVLDDGTSMGAIPGNATIVSNINRTWAFAWEPEGGLSGGGLLTVNLDGQLLSIDLAESQRNQIQGSFNAFGFNSDSLSNTVGNPNYYADYYIDDITYSAPFILQGDISDDGLVDALDIDLLRLNIGGDPDVFDLNGDTFVTPEDVDFLVFDILGTVPGDANLDQRVDLVDFSILKTHFGETDDIGWSTAEFDGNGVIGLDDFALLKNNFGFSGGAASVPEPSSLLLAAIACVVLLRRSCINRIESYV